MSELTEQIDKAKFDLYLEETYLYSLQKLIGDPEVNQKSLRQKIAKSKKDIEAMKTKRNNLLAEWAAKEYRRAE